MNTDSLATRRVLAIGAHPDDIEILCAGTMARYSTLGVEVTLCTVTNGSRGGFDRSMEETARTRKEEANRSARIIGAGYRCLDVEDGEVTADQPEIRRRFVELIREIRPDVVFTHFPDDYHADHIATSRLAFDASFMAAVPLYGSTRGATDKVLPVYYMDTLAGLEFSPEDYVDITDSIDTKRRMLAEHQSQVVWMSERDGLDILDLITTQSRFRGYQCGVPYAEGFRRAHTWLRNSPNRLLP